MGEENKWEIEAALAEGKGYNSSWKAYEKRYGKAIRKEIKRLQDINQNLELHWKKQTKGKKKQINLRQLSDTIMINKLTLLELQGCRTPARGLRPHLHHPPVSGKR